MKNIRISQVLLLMSLAIGSSFTIQAYNDTNKYSHDKTKKGKQQAKAFANGKQDMKAIERDLKKIKKEFDKNHNASQANEQLDRIPARIKKAVQEMKTHEQAGRMWETHEHTLNRKLKEIRKFVKEYAQENK